MKNPLRFLRLRLGAVAENSLDASRSPLLRRLHELEQKAGEQGRCLQVFTFMEWIRQRDRIHDAIDLRRSADPRSTRSAGTRNCIGDASNLFELATRGGR